MRSLIMSLILLIASSAYGQSPNYYTFEVLPIEPIAGQTFEIRVTLQALSCLFLPDEVVVTPIAGNIVQYELHMEDVCFPYPEQRRIYQVSPLAAGTYTFRFASCLHASPPLPNEQCNTATERRVTVVAGANQSHGIAALTQGSIMLLVASVALVGLTSLRRT